MYTPTYSHENMQSAQLQNVVSFFCISRTRLPFSTTHLDVVPLGIFEVVWQVRGPRRPKRHLCTCMQMKKSALGYYARGRAAKCSTSKKFHSKSRYQTLSVTMTPAHKSSQGAKQYSLAIFRVTFA